MSLYRTLAIAFEIILTATAAGLLEKWTGMDGLGLLVYYLLFRVIVHQAHDH